MEDQELSQQIRELGRRHAAPESLRAGLRSHLALAAVLQNKKPNRLGLAWLVQARDAVLQGRGMTWSAGLSGFAVGVMMMAFVPATIDRLGLGAPDDEDITASHLRSLRVGPLVEVVSTDRHTVKPWFQGKLDFAPPVFDLAPEGFPLKGGRVEHLNRTTAAGLVYGRNQHVINLYVWPSVHDEAARPTSVRGFNTRHWAVGGMQYWLVSDLDSHELERFEALWRQRVATQ